MKKIFFLFISTLLMSTLSLAEDIIVGELKYMHEGNNTVRCIGFANESSTATSVYIPGYIVYNGTTYQVECVGNYAFRHNQYLKSVRIGYGVQSLLPQVFYDTPNLKEVYLPSSLNALHRGCFGMPYSSKYFTTVAWAIQEYPGDGVNNNKGVDPSAFENALGNTTLYVSTYNARNKSFLKSSWITSNFYNVLQDGSKAYDFADSTWGVTYIVSTPKTGDVQSSTSDYTGKVTIVGLQPGKTVVLLQNNVQDDFNYQYGSTILRYAVADVADYAFNANSLVTKVDVTNVATCIERIGKSAFDGCINLASLSVGASTIDERAFYNTGITLASMNEGTVTVGKNAFGSCTKLYQINIPSTVTELNQDYFWTLPSMKYYSVETENAKYSSDTNGILYDGDKLNLYHCPPKAVSSTSLLSNLPSSLIRIEKHSFHQFGGAGVVIPYGTQVLGDSAFYGSSLKYVKVPSTVRIEGARQFSECKQLIEMNMAMLEPYRQTLGNFITFPFPSGFHARVATPALEDYQNTIPWMQMDEGMLTDGGYDVVWNFGGNNGLTVGTILDFKTKKAHIVHVNEDYRNRHTETLVKGDIVIPETLSYWNQTYTVKEICDKAFMDATGLTGITIPNSVNYIGSLAFYNCTGLAEIHSQITNPTSAPLGNNVFYGVPKTTCKLYVPAGTLQLYRNAAQWKDFLNIEEEGGLTGDVNGDGTVNVSDVTALVNMILGVIPKDEQRADVDGNGTVNVSDVTALVNLILGIG